MDSALPDTRSTAHLKLIPLDHARIPRYQTRGMPKHNLALNSRRGGRRPAARQSSLQELIGRRSVVPDGDRRHDPESGRIINQPQPTPIRDQDIVAVLILRHHVGWQERRFLSHEPIEGVLDGTMAGHQCGDLTEIVGSDARAVFDGEAGFQSPLRRRMPFTR